VLLIEGYDAVAVVLWFLALYSLLYINNFINIILSNKDNLFGIFLTNSSCFGYTITDFLMLPIILRHFSMPFSIRIGLCNTSCVHLLVCMLLLSNFKRIYIWMRSSKHDVAKTEDLTWLNQFGTIGTFLKNDIK
jgi:hypothetical protein